MIKDLQFEKDRPEPTYDRKDTSGATAMDDGFLAKEMDWLRMLIEYRCKELVQATNVLSQHNSLNLPTLQDGIYAGLIEKYKLDDVGRVILALAFATEFDQSIFIPILKLRQLNAKQNMHFGGCVDDARNMFFPSFQTVLFLLAGNNSAQKIKFASQLCQGHVLLDEQIIYSIGDAPLGMQNTIELDGAYYKYILTGEKPRLDHGRHFPAKLHITSATMDDIVLGKRARDKILPLAYYMLASKKLFYENGGHKFRKGFIALLYGPPGTGKTYLAGILANTYKKDIYRVDLSQVVSKYIGETEKNLELLFNRLEGKDCILFFDEADALFGKRGEVKDAHDRFANQEVSYLLQRIENFDGLVLLATNHQGNMDEAFMRRINIMVDINRPQKEERMALWKFYLPQGYSFSSPDLLRYLSEKYGYTGANIRNIMEMLSLEMHEKNTKTISLELIAPYLLSENHKAFGLKSANTLADYNGYGI